MFAVILHFILYTDNMLLHQYTLEGGKMES